MAERAQIQELPGTTRLLLRCGPELLPALGAAFGVALPAQPLTSATAGARAALWLGPDEWLLLAGDATPAALQATLEAARGDGAASIVDISDRHRAFELTGPEAAALLNEGCPLDLADAAFPPGACTRSVFGKVEITLWRPAPGRWRVEVARSFAAHLAEHLRQAARDLGPAAAG
jgi:sarcosine oxidase subunit gamma